MKHAVLGLLIAGTAAFSAQSSLLLSRADLETPLLIVWGLALLAVGQRVKTAGRQDATVVKTATGLGASPVRAGAQTAETAA
jgi:hypothetical protein